MKNTIRQRWCALAVLSALGVTLSMAPRVGAQPVHDAATAREVVVVVDGGFTPARIEATAGERLRLRFERRDYGPCTAAVVFPTLGLRRALPSDQTTVVELPVLAAGEVPFECAMHMARGVIVVRPR